MTRAVVMAFHKYTPFGDEFYEPILDFQLQTFGKYKDEYDTLYLLDSTWSIDEAKYYLPDLKAKVIKVNPSLRYYDAYKEVLPQIQEDLVLFMDNDMLVYKEDIIRSAFEKLEKYDVVSIYDTIGNYTHPMLNGKSKFCPYWFATRKDLLMKYCDCDWGPNMPHYETLGKLTQEMIAHDVRAYEWEEDKSSIYFDGSKTDEKGKDLGYYHIRAGSTPAYLMATKKYGDKKTYEEYLKNQPRNEYLRQCFWYDYMNRKVTEGIWKLTDLGMEFSLMLHDMEVGIEEWENYCSKCFVYHGLT